MSQPTPVEGWSELLLALPEFLLTHVFVDEHDELVAHVELPRDGAALHPLRDDRAPPGPRPADPHGPSPARRRARHQADLAQAAAGLHRGVRHVQRTDRVDRPGAVWSRAAARAAVAVSEANVPIDTIRKSFGVGWNTVMRAVVAPPTSSLRSARAGSGSTRRS